MLEEAIYTLEELAGAREEGDAADTAAATGVEGRICTLESKTCVSEKWILELEKSSVAIEEQADALEE